MQLQSIGGDQELAEELYFHVAVADINKDGIQDFLLETAKGILYILGKGQKRMTDAVPSRPIRTASNRDRRPPFLSIMTTTAI